jgi:hypothetical protein
LATLAQSMYNSVIDATNNRTASTNLPAEASKQMHDQGVLKLT